MKKKNRSLLVWGCVSAGVVVLLTTATILATTTFRSILTTVLGGPSPIMAEGVEAIYTSDYATKEESKEAGDALNKQIAEEGSVLLLNEKSALPLAQNERKVSVFGKNSVNLVLGGSGSGGGISGDTAKTIYDGLDAAGIEYNPVLKSFYESSESGSGRSDSPALSEGSTAAPTLDIGETPKEIYTTEVRQSFSEYSDAAIVVISRLGGESWDLPRSQNPDAGGIEGNHYLQLYQNEYDMLDMVTSRFKKVIVVLNTLTSFQCDFIEEYNNVPSDPRIDALVWIGGPGSTGAESFGRLLTGERNFSGRTVDIYSRDFTKDPTWQNFGDNSQVEGGSNAFMEGSAASSQYYVSYEEGIYTGYRYYETRGYEESKLDRNIAWYEENVIFPFGYGLSYAEFDQEMTMDGQLLDAQSELTFEVTVENTGDVPGKEVVELYVSLPYTQGGIEKSYVQLVDFAKTEELEQGDLATFTFHVDPYDLASYDYNDANGNGHVGYETEKGEYTFYLAKNSHVTEEENVFATATVTLDQDILYEKDPDTGNTVENRYTFGENYDGVEEDETVNFNDIQYRLQDVYVLSEDGTEHTRKGMSRSNFEDTFPETDTEQERIFLDGEKAALEDKTTNNTVIDEVTEMPTTGAEGTLTLFDVIGADYDDPKWDQILDRLTPDEMLTLVNNGAFQTSAISKIKKNLTNDSDGPIGFVNFMPGLSQRYKNNTTFACEIVIGSTWSKDLAYQMGKIVGDNGVWGDYGGNYLPYSGWYAPAVNLHRSPFGGRNFEYYSEDPVLSGKMAVNVINGAAQKGVYTDLKHFALNEQETARGGVATYCTEQALRELYLKPFEMAVKGMDDPVFSKTATADKVATYVGTKGVMSSFNRIGTRWTGGDYRLMTEILRDEWGFRGLVICDYKTDNSVMDSRQMLYAGNDLILASLPDLLWNDCDFDDAKDVTILRNATHNILYAVANSNSMNVDIIGYRMEWWISTFIVVDAVAFVALTTWGVFLFIRRGKKHDDEGEKKEEEKAQA